MTKKTQARGGEPREPRSNPRRRVARGIIRRALTDPAIFDAIVTEADAPSSEARDRVLAARKILLAVRDPRPWTARAERRLAAYRRNRRSARGRLSSADWRPMSLLLAWAEVPERRGR